MFDNSLLSPPESYDNSQYNAKGDSLSPTPLSNGAPIAVDHSNDTRTAADFKTDAQQANKDTQDVSNSDGWTSKAGNVYSAQPTRKDMIIDGVIAMGMSYLSGGDAGQQLQAMSSAVWKSDGRAKRFKKIDELESKGYNSIDIDKWIETGDTKDLLTNKGKWEDNHDGSQTNSLTGERRNVSLSPLQIQAQQNVEAQQQAQAKRDEQNAAYQNSQLDISRGSQEIQKQNLEVQNRRLDLEDSRYNAGVQLAAQEKATAKQEKETTRQDTITSSLDALDAADRTTRDLLANPSLPNIYGATGKLPTLTDESRRAEANRNQLSSQQFLAQRQQLKGAGAITDFEGQKAERAASIATDPNVDADSAKQALYQIVDINALGRARLQARKADPNAPMIQAAPDEALSHLRDNYVKLAPAFKQKYGYLPVYH